MADPTLKEWGRALLIAVAGVGFLMAASAAWSGAHGGQPADAPNMGQFIVQPADPIIVDGNEFVVDTIDGLYRVAIVDPLENTHYMTVVFDNRLVYAPHTPWQYTFQIDGHEIIVIMAFGSGDAPDLMTVIPPQGYIAIPTEISVEEDAHGIIEIHRYLGG